MRCVITGVAGFIGSSLCDRLLAEGHEVRGIDCFVDYYPRLVKEANLAAAFKHPRFEFLEGDLLKADLGKILAGAEWVFHQAAQAGVRGSFGASFAGYVDNNILATQRLLECARVERSIRCFIYASSSSVYGDAETFPTPEDVIPKPVSPYGVTKLAAENLVSLYAREFGVPAVSLRYFTVFGPRQRPDMAFHRFIKAALNREEIVIYGDGSQSRDFTFIADAIEANLLAAERGEPGQVFNIGGGVQATINHVLELLQSELGSLHVKRAIRQPGDARHTSADTSKARRLLGFCPRVGLAEGLHQEIEWLKTQAVKAGR